MTQISMQLLRDEKNSIPYRPKIAKEIGVIPSIILQQIIYRSEKGKFYKFIEPSTHEKYREGDSWCEELGMKVDMFKDNLKKIGFKLGKSKNIINKEDALVLYYTDKDRVTRYEIQYDNVNNLISYIYDTSYLVNGDSPDRLVNGEFPDTNSTENTTNTLVKVPVEKIIETWNSIDGFKTTIKITTTIRDQWNRVMKEYSLEEFETAVNKYYEDTKTRTKTNDPKGYDKHRFTFYEFIKQDNGLQKWINT